MQGASSSSAFEPWKPAVPGEEQPSSPGSPRPVVRLTRDLLGTLAALGLVYDRQSQPRRCLTKGGPGNPRQDMVVYVGDVLRGGGTRATYAVTDVLGSGTFGQVFRATRDMEGHTQDEVAIKVVRAKPAYTKQGLVEIGIIEHLNRADSDDRRHVVRMLDYFVCRGHVCLVFELLSVNLYELLKSNSYRGLSATLVRVFLAQLLDATALIRDQGVLHCDLKPENILLASAAHPLIKVIDFGSACYEAHTASSYIQSRFYRSPEVLIGILPFSS